MLPLMQLKSYQLLRTGYDGKWKRGKYQDWGTLLSINAAGEARASPMFLRRRIAGILACKLVQ